MNDLDRDDDVQQRAHAAKHESRTALKPVGLPDSAGAGAERRCTRAVLRAVEDALHVVVLTLDEAGRVTEPQPGWEAYTGQSFEKSRGRGFLRALHAEDRATFGASWLSGLRTGKGFECQARVVHHLTGATRSCIFRVSPVELDGGEGRVWVSIVSDLTLPQRLDPESAALLASVEESRMESLRTLARGIAHQLNNILHGILIHAELVRRKLEPGHPALPSLCEVTRGAERGALFGKQLMTFAGNVTSPRERCDLASLVRRMHAPLAAMCGEHVHLRVDESCPHATVRVAASQLEEVIKSLMTNALEALPPSGGTITLRAGAKVFSAGELAGARPLGIARPGRYAYLELTDDGRGMSPGLVARVFEPFFANKQTGRGLNLPLVLAVVQAFEGLVDIRSEQGRGTRVRILLPELNEH